MTRRTLRVWVAGAVVVALAVTAPIALGAHSRAAAAAKVARPGDVASGKKVFVTFCGRCHVMQAAGTHGTIGPNLDQDKVTYSRVVTAIEEGVGGIQAEYLLQGVTFSQVYDVAKFVVAARQ